MKQHDRKPKPYEQADVYQTLKKKFYEKEAGNLLDTLTYTFNKKHLQTLVDKALDEGNKEAFHHYSSMYKNWVHQKLPS